ncbi:extracellular solute-binding protein [Cohnella sp. GCM10020058]|uniref:extracellular solute-binding protein n=1 Tax=Cohnella sp. GCM10020058 TaxID=3317330 RepID=UPI00362A5A0D
MIEYSKQILGIAVRMALAVLGALAVLAALTGCLGGGGNQAASTAVFSKAGDQSASASVSSAEPLTMLTEESQAWPARPDWPVWRWVREATNIAIEQVTQTGPESMALAIASGDMPDLFTVYPADAQKYGSRGAFLDLFGYLDRMPHVRAFLASRPDVAVRMTSPSGEMYQLLSDGSGAGNQIVWFYRDDIFDKHGLKPPSTWDELYETAKTLKRLYPDSYPFVFRHGLGTLATFGPAFGIYPSFYQDPETGEVKYGPTDPNFKAMIGYLRKFYAEGLMPPDWLSMDYKAWTQFMTTNQSFITVQYIGQIEIMNAQLEAGEHLTFMAPPSGLDGFAYLPRKDYEPLGYAISAKTERLDTALRYLDFLYADEGMDLMSWGKEGETYEVVDGKRRLLPLFKEPNDLRKKAGIMTAGTYGRFDYSSLMSLSGADEQNAYREAAKYASPISGEPPMLDASEIAWAGPALEQLDKYYGANVSRFILGYKPMSEWDAFIEGLNKLNLTKLKELYRLAFDRAREAGRP